MGKIDEIRETVQEAYDIMDDLNCNLFGLYDYIRYCNEDFGEDMIINDEKPISDNSQIQHYYLVCFIDNAINGGHEIPEAFIQLYLSNKEIYDDEHIGKEVKNIEARLTKN